MLADPRTVPSHGTIAEHFSGFSHLRDVDEGTLRTGVCHGFHRVTLVQADLSGGTRLVTSSVEHLATKHQQGSNTYAKGSVGHLRRVCHGGRHVTTIPLSTRRTTETRKHAYYVGFGL